MVPQATQGSEKGCVGFWGSQWEGAIQLPVLSAHGACFLVCTRKWPACVSGSLVRYLLRKWWLLRVSYLSFGFLTRWQRSGELTWRLQHTGIWTLLVERGEPGGAVLGSGPGEGAHSRDRCQGSLQRPTLLRAKPLFSCTHFSALKSQCKICRVYAYIFIFPGREDQYILPDSPRGRMTPLKGNEPLLQRHFSVHAQQCACEPALHYSLKPPGLSLHHALTHAFPSTFLPVFLLQEASSVNYCQLEFLPSPGCPGHLSVCHFFTLDN